MVNKKLATMLTINMNNIMGRSACISIELKVEDYTM